ncbi:hypothetical protein BU15DRAFT_70225 [Melanogaster broomeanus]|nr:hypothetical protein BU15DRAFT_70225 [Melanogaster broomeanus]
MTNGDSSHAAVIQPAQPPPKEQLYTKNANMVYASFKQPKQWACPVGDTTLMDKLQHALHHIKVLESGNSKLYEDNSQLVAAISALNDRVAFSGASHNTQVLHLAELQEKLRHLAIELQATRNAYAHLEREHHFLSDKYARLKAAWGTGHVTQQQVPPATSHRAVSASYVQQGHNPMPENDSRIRIAQSQGQSRSTPVSPTSAISPGGMQGSLQQQQQDMHRRRSSEGGPQQPLRRAPTQNATTRPPNLPTPPPSTSLYRGPISPSGFPVHVPMQLPVGAFPPHPHSTSAAHPPVTHGPRSVFGPAMLPQGRHPAGQAAIYVPNFQGTKPDQHHGEVVDLARDRSAATHYMQGGPPTPPKSSSPQSVHSLKRSSSDFQASARQPGELKKPRMEGGAQKEAGEPTTAGADTPNQNRPTAPPSSIAPLSGGADCPSNTKSAGSDSDENIRSYEECVNLIFEKDADVDDGVFCGLCFDRYEAKMIPEPPDVLIQPEFDSLVKHCMTMHPTAWQDLRNRKDLEKK